MHNLHVQTTSCSSGLCSHASAEERHLDQIKIVDATFGDLTCDIGIDPSLAPPKPAAPETKTYTVQSGDTLSKIAQQFYGNAASYMKIFEANKDKLSDPNKIQ